MGGAHGGGVVFKLTRSGDSWTESVLWSFTGGSGGTTPLRGVIFDSAGNLYGTAAFDGAYGNGAVYELSPSGSGWTQTTLYSFGAEDGGDSPSGGVTMDAQGNLYGTTGGSYSSGSGEAYELTFSDGSWTVSRRQIFSLYEGGFNTPALDAQGNLYGTINLGTNETGEVFRLTPSGNGWNYIDLYDFTTDGSNPIGGVIIDSSGNVYGITAGGGYDGGTVWEITP